MKSVGDPGFWHSAAQLSEYSQLNFFDGKERRGWVLRGVSSYDCYNICFIKAIIQDSSPQVTGMKRSTWVKVRDYVVLYFKCIAPSKGVYRELQRNSQKLPFIVQFLKHFLSYIKNSNPRKFTLLWGYCLPRKSPLRYFLVENSGVGGEFKEYFSYVPGSPRTFVSFFVPQFPFYIKELIFGFLIEWWEA